jgi:hypothetical protein
LHSCGDKPLSCARCDLGPFCRVAAGSADQASESRSLINGLHHNTSGIALAYFAKLFFPCVAAGGFTSVPHPGADSPSGISRFTQMAARPSEFFFGRPQSRPGTCMRRMALAQRRSRRLQCGSRSRDRANSNVPIDIRCRRPARFLRTARIRRAGAPLNADSHAFATAWPSHLPT